MRVLKLNLILFLFFFFLHRRLAYAFIPYVLAVKTRYKDYRNCHSFNIFPLRLFFFLNFFRICIFNFFPIVKEKTVQPGINFQYSSTAVVFDMSYLSELSLSFK